MSVAYSQTLARMEAPAVTWSAAISVCVSMAGAGPTALRTLTTAPQQHAAPAPPVSTASRHLSAFAPLERRVSQYWQTTCRYFLHQILELHNVDNCITRYNVRYCEIVNIWKQIWKTVEKKELDVIHVKQSETLIIPQSRFEFPADYWHILGFGLSLTLIILSPAANMHFSLLFSDLSRTLCGMFLFSDLLFKTFYSFLVNVVFFSGLLCHRDDACISNPCREGSQCDTNPISGMFNCNCPPGYVGNTCNIDRDECSIGEKAEHTHNMYLCQASDLFCFYSHLFPLRHQVPTPASTVVSVWTLMAPSPVTVLEVTLGHAVSKMSTSVPPAPARTMAHV